MLSFDQAANIVAVERQIGCLAGLAAEEAQLFGIDEGLENGEAGPEMAALWALVGGKRGRFPYSLGKELLLKTEEGSISAVSAATQK